MALLISLLLSVYSYADSPYERYQARSSDRWTIASWFETKHQVHLMDQWLSHHRKEPANIFDFEIGLSQDNSSTHDTTYYGANLALYFYFIGLEGSYSQNKDDEDLTKHQASLHVRLLGSNNQTTRWTLYYGQDFTPSWEPNFYGTRLSVYITSFLGIEGTYTKFLEQTNDLGLLLEGEKKDFSVFIDIYFLRLYGKWIEREVEVKTPSPFIYEKDKSFESGFVFFF